MDDRFFHLMESFSIQLERLFGNDRPDPIPEIQERLDRMIDRLDRLIEILEGDKVPAKASIELPAVTDQEICRWSWKLNGCTREGCTATAYRDDSDMCRVKAICPQTGKDIGCHAGRDGECNWHYCPQEFDYRATGEMKSSCPLWNPREDDR